MEKKLQQLSLALDNEVQPEIEQRFHEILHNTVALEEICTENRHHSLIIDAICDPILCSGSPSTRHAIDLLTWLLGHTKEWHVAMGLFHKVSHTIKDAVLTAQALDEEALKRKAIALNCLWKILLRLEGEVLPEVSQLCQDVLISAISLANTALRTLLSQTLLPVSVKYEMPAFLNRFLQLAEANDLALEAFCLVAEYLFSPQGRLVFDMWTRDNRLWSSVYCGLTSCDSLRKKQSLYLLQRATDYILKGECEPPLSHFDGSWFVFIADTFTVQRRLWDAYFVILDTLHEKQAHIVKQVLSQLEELLVCLRPSTDSATSLLHPKWLYLIYDLLFGHQNQAVVSWAVNHFLQQFELLHSPDFVCGSLLVALNSTRLYGDPHGLPQSLNVYIAHMVCKLDRPADFWNTLIQSMCGLSWGPVPLFFVSRAVHQVSTVLPSNAVLATTVETLDRLRGFLSFDVRCQEPLIRGAAQCYLLEAMINTFQPADCGVQLDLLLQFLLPFLYPPRQLLFRGTQLWRRVSVWLKAAASGTRSTSSLGPDKLALITVMLCDLDAMNVMEDPLVLKAVAAIEGTLYRSYAAPATSELSFVSHVWHLLHARPLSRPGKGFLTFCTLDEDTNTCKAAALPISHPADFGAAMWKCLMSSVHDVGAVDVERQVAMLVQVCDAVHLETHLEGLKNVFLHGGVVAAAEPPALAGAQLYLGAVLLSAYSAWLTAQPSWIWSLRAGLLQRSFPLSPHKVNLTGSLASLLLKWQWSFLGVMVNKTDVLADADVAISILCMAPDHLSAAGRDGLVTIVTCVSDCLRQWPVADQRPDPDQLQSFADLAMSSVFELRQCAAFWPALEACASLLSAMSHHPPHDSVQSHVTGLLAAADSVRGIAAVLVDQPLPDSVALLVLTECLLYGPISSRSQRIVIQVNSFISLQQQSLPVNFVEGSDHLLDSRIRTAALKALASHVDAAGVSSLVDALRAKYEQITGTGATGRKSVIRYFEHSIHHLKLVRLLQALLVLTERLLPADHSSSHDLFEICQSCLVAENHRPSVRFLAEWILIRLMAKSLVAVDKLKAAFTSGCEARLAAAPSFLNVFAHSALLTGDRDRLEEAVEVVAPWCMSQHFGTRLYGQVTVTRLLGALEQRFGPLEAKNRMLLQVVQDAMKLGRADKNTERISSDFYLSDFDPDMHFNLENIFHDWPRLSLLPQTECISIEALPDVDQLGVALRREDSSWNRHRQHRCLCRTCVPTASMVSDAGGELAVSAGSLELGHNIQTKITPWKEMLEEADDGARLACVRKPAHPELILVASLIDRPANLGGLCRTCEILGVGLFVVGCEGLAKDRDFQNLSVTAHHWMPMLEVKRAELCDYLLHQKKQGYSVLGVEQTSDSVSLDTFCFPTKCLLVLGSEKQGLPIDVIQMMDACIEIPQFGVVRSLNVHVSGALVIWEYVRQHRALAP